MARNDQVQLDINEEILGLIRQSPIALFPRLLVGGIWMLFPFFFLFQFIASGLIGMVLFVLALISGIWCSYSAWKKWYGSTLTLTEKRIIDVDQQTIKYQQISELTYAEIDDVILDKTMFIEKITSLKTLTITSFNPEQFDIEFPRVTKAEQVKSLILDIKYMNTNDELMHGRHASQKENES